MSYNSNLPADVNVTVSTADIRENFRALKEDKIVAAATAVTAESAEKLANARVITLKGDAVGSASFDGSANVAIAVDVLSADVSASCTGNAASATKLETARNINGVAFDGTKDITITAAANGGNADTLNGKSADNIITICAPAGAVQYFAMQKAPVGWLKADGSAVSRKEYANLFAAVGTMFGAGDGSTTFNLPDLRGEFIRGFDDGRGVDSSRVLGSRQNGSLMTFDLRSDAIWGLSETTQSRATALSTFCLDEISGVNINGKLNWVAQGGRSDSAIDGGAGVSRPRNVALLACIKY